MSLAALILDPLFTAAHLPTHFEILPKVVTEFKALLEKFTSAQNPYVPAFEREPEAAWPLLNIATSNLVYNTKDSFAHAVMLYDLLLSHSPPASLHALSLKFVGPIIRVINYRLEQDQKKALLDLLSRLTTVDLKPFYPQLQASYVRLAAELAHNAPLVKIVARNLVQLLTFTPRRDTALHDIFARYIAENNLLLREGFLHILNAYIKHQAKSKRG
jgi:hypothetical protein